MGRRRVTEAAAPPPAGTLDNPLSGPGAKTMRPSRFHVPPRAPRRRSQISWATPPASVILFSLPRAKKAMERPSGDQKGRVPPSLPSIARVSTESKRRTHSFREPSANSAPNTRRLPSGETAMSAVPRGNLVPSGAYTEKLVRRAIGVGRGARLIATRRRRLKPTAAATARRDIARAGAAGAARLDRSW